MTATIPTEDVDLFDDAVLADPYPVYARLREAGAVVHLPGRDLWAVTRYDEVRRVLGDPSTFSSTTVAFNPTMNDILRGSSLASDPPEHTALRAVLTEILSPRAVRPLRAGIAEKADALVAELAHRGSFEGMADLARALPLSIVADLIGVPAQVKPKMLAWGEAAFDMLGPLNERAQSGFPLAGELFGWAHEMKGDELAEGSLGRAIFDAEARGDIPPGAAGMIVHQIVAAGMDTTITSIGNALLAFGDHPDQYAKLREDPSQASVAFAEVQRYLTPMPVTGRGVLREVELGGVTLPPGAQLAVMLASGNRDERHYPDPEVFDITRNPADHLTFGYGIHGCAGQGLAKLQAHALLESLARHVGSFRIGERERHITNMTQPYARFEVLDVVPA